MKNSPSTVQGRSKTVCVTLQSEVSGLTVMMKNSPSTVQGRSKTVCVTLQSEVSGLTVMMKNSPHLLYKAGPNLSVLHRSQGQGVYYNDEKLSPSTVQGRSKTVCVTLQSEVRGLTVMMKNSPHLLYKVGPRLSVLHCSQKSVGLL